MADDGFGIGLTAETITNVEEMAVFVPPPKALPPKWPTEISLPSGQVRRMGFPTQIWHFGYLDRAQRDQLRDFCPGKSAEVYITTEIFDDVTSTPTFADYRAVMVWGEEDPDSSVIKDFSLTFVLKEQLELPS